MFQTLIVEDNQRFRRSLSELLINRFPCMIVEEASTGVEAMAKFKLFTPQLVFMDIKLPDSNGLDLTRRIRRGDWAVVVVVMTAHDIPEYWEAAFQAGADFFVSKAASSGADIASLVDAAFPSACGQDEA